MARGRLLRTKKKEIRELVQARLEGIRRFYRKHPTEWLKAQFPTIMENGHKVLEFGAILGMTFIIKKIIDADEVLVEKVLSIAQGKEAWWTYLLPIMGVAGIGAELAIAKPEETSKELFEAKSTESIEWLISLMLAYLIVHHFGDIMHSIGGGLSSIKTLVSALMV